MKESPMTAVNNGRWIKVIVEVIIVLFAVAAAWATLRSDVIYNCNNVRRNDARITKVEDNQAEIKTDVRVILKEQQYIKEGVDEIKEKLK